MNLPVKISRCIAPALICCLAISAASSQPVFWQQSIAGGDFFSFTSSQSGAVIVSPGTFVNMSTDEGQTWQTAVPASPFFFFNLTTASQGKIYGAGPGVARSTDNGGTWVSLPNPMNFNADVVVMRPNGHLFVGTGTRTSSQGGIYRSIDDGQTWSLLRLGAHLRFTEVPSMMVTPGGDIIASTYNSTNRVYLSRNDGTSWRALPLPVSQNWWWVFGVASNGDLLASGGVRTVQGIVPTLYRSSNGGLRWKKLHAFPGDIAITSLIATNNGGIYLSSYNGGVYRSTDDGLTFSQINSGLTNTAIRKLGLSGGGYLYALSGDGVHRSQQPVGIPPTFTQSPLHTQEIRPVKCRLDQNYPNPFNPVTRLSFELTQDALVTLKIYDALGEEVADIAHGEEFSEGANELEFNASSLPSGVYFYHLVVRDRDRSSVIYSNTRKMLLMK